MNPQVLTTTQEVDSVFLFIFGISLLMLLGIAATLVYFAVRYNRKDNPQPTSEMDSNVWLEIIWTLIPTALVLAMFYYGWAGYLALRNVPEGACEVSVTGRMWSWSFDYPNGRSSEKLVIPAGKPIKVRINSADVLHSFYIPAFRVKRDAVPGMESYLWFSAPETGSYDIFCAEYCGQRHANMITTVEALSEKDFEKWYTSKADAGDAGKDLLAKHGCISCHSTDGTPRVGPTFKGLWGRKVKVLRDGKSVEIMTDADYIRNSILYPQKEIVEGFQPLMPVGQLNEDELKTVIRYFEASE